MSVVTTRVVTLEDGNEGEITGYQITGGHVGKLKSSRDRSVVTCDFAACKRGKLVEKGPAVIVLEQNEDDVPAEYWSTLTLGNAKNEVRVFCSKGCLFQYLQTDFVVCPIPGRENVIEFPGTRG